MAAIARREGCRYHWLTSYGFLTDYLEFVKNIRNPVDRRIVIGRAMLEGACADCRRTSDPEYRLSRNSKERWLSHILGVPLLREGDPIGVIFLARKSVRPFTDKQIELVTYIRRPGGDRD